MEQSVRESRSVLVICTVGYKQRFDGRKGGAGYEGHIITSEILGSEGTNKFIPVLRHGEWANALPTYPSGKTIWPDRGVRLDTVRDEA